MDFKNKEHYSIDDLREIVKALRAPDGCPWDKVQTHQSIRQDFIEEVYEAAEAIDENDQEHLREELGDVLFQVVFHCAIEEEQGGFTLDDIADEVSRKMVIRHPHVFGDVTADTTEKVLKNWDAIKMQTHAQKTASEAMDSVSKTLPSLMRSEKLIKKAKRGGVAPKNAEEVFDKISSSLETLKQSYAQGSTENYDTQMGELLFAVTGLSEFLNTKCEQSLYNACEDFTEQFKQLEKLAAEQGIDIQGADADTLNKLRSQIKKEKDLEEI